MMKHRSLIARLFLLVGAVILTGSLLIILLAQMTLTAAFNRIEKRVTEARNWALINYLEQYYDRHRNWDNLEDDFRRRFPENPRPGRRRHMMHHDMEMPPSPEFNPFTLLDSENNIVFIHQPPGSSPCPAEDCQRYALSGSNGTTVGYLLIPPPGSGQSRQERLLRRIIGGVISGVAGLITVLTLLASGLFLRKSLQPITEMTTASREMTRGNFSQRVQERGEGEIRDLAEQFNKMSAAMEERDLWKRRLIADTAHELRTPITLLLGRIEMLQENVYPLNREQLGFLGRDVVNMKALVQDLQDLSEAESPEQRLEIENSRPYELWAELVSLYREDLDQKNINVNIDVHKNLEAPLDWRKCRTLMKNLLSKALDFTPENGQIRLSARSEGNTLVIKVEDSGPGIPKDQQEKIFERFYRLEPSRNRKYGGRGLGLAISLALVQAHGGKISVGDSSLGGAEFTVKLPLGYPQENF